MSVYTHYSFQAGSSFPTWSSWTWAWQWTPTWGENLALSSTSIMSRYFRDVSRRVFNRRSLSLMYFTSHLMNTMNDNWKQNFPLARSVRRSVGHIGWSVDRLVGPSIIFSSKSGKFNFHAPIGVLVHTHTYTFVPKGTRNRRDCLPRWLSHHLLWCSCICPKIQDNHPRQLWACHLQLCVHRLVTFLSLKFL